MGERATSANGDSTTTTVGQSFDGCHRPPPNSEICRKQQQHAIDLKMGESSRIIRTLEQRKKHQYVHYLKTQLNDSSPTKMKAKPNNNRTLRRPKPNSIQTTFKENAPALPQWCNPDPKPIPVTRVRKQVPKSANSNTKWTNPEPKVVVPVASNNQQSDSEEDRYSQDSVFDDSCSDISCDSVVEKITPEASSSPRKPSLEAQEVEDESELSVYDSLDDEKANKAWGLTMKHQPGKVFDSLDLSVSHKQATKLLGVVSDLEETPRVAQPQPIQPAVAWDVPASNQPTAPMQQSRIPPPKVRAPVLKKTILPKSTPSHSKTNWGIRSKDDDAVVEKRRQLERRKAYARDLAAKNKRKLKPTNLIQPKYVIKPGRTQSPKKPNHNRGLPRPIVH